MGDRRRRALSPREHDMLASIARFKQLTPSHIYALHFTTTKHTMYRAITRLHEAKYIYPVERFRLVGGEVGGSGQHVWCAAGPGYKALSLPGSPPRYTTAHPHKLGVASVYTGLLTAHRAGQLVVHGMSIDQEVDLEAAGILRRPDIHTEITSASGYRQDYIIEVDRGSENRPEIRSKLLGYWRAFNSGGLDSAAWPRIPLVVLVAFSEERLHQLGWWVERLPAEVQSIVLVTDLAGFITPLTTPTYPQQ